MGIYVYALYEPTDPPLFLGAWERIEDAAKACNGNYEEGSEPAAPSLKKYRLVQLYFTRAGQQRE